MKSHVVEGLTEQHPGSDPKKWTHRKGTAIVDYYGDDRKADIHWFQEEHVGKCSFKIKEWLDDD